MFHLSLVNSLADSVDLLLGQADNFTNFKRGQLRLITQKCSCVKRFFTVQIGAFDGIFHSAADSNFGDLRLLKGQFKQVINLAFGERKQLGSFVANAGFAARVDAVYACRDEVIERNIGRFGFTFRQARKLGRVG